MKKERLDQLLIEKQLFPTIDQARRAILAGLVKVDDQVLAQVGSQVRRDARIEVKKKEHPYVSRGGMKLAKAIDVFALRLAKRIVLDIGASTGGFTDCALQHGAAHVYAVDVGTNQLAWKLRQDPRVTVLERTNFRYLSADQLQQGTPSLATLDVSFISLAHLFPNLWKRLAPDGEVVALIKPQFEAERQQVETKGVVRDPAVHRQVLHKTLKNAETQGFKVKGLSFSPIQGNAGNIEFLAFFARESVNAVVTSEWDDRINQTVSAAHLAFVKPKRSS